MSNEITVIDVNSTEITISAKTGKTGSLAKAIAFADRASRLDLSKRIYHSQLSNGMYRPFINDVLSSNLMPKAVSELVQTIVGVTGPADKAKLATVCEHAAAAVRVKESKARAANKDFALKGQNEFLFGLVQRILTDLQAPVVEAQ